MTSSLAVQDDPASIPGGMEFGLKLQSLGNFQPEQGASHGLDDGGSPQVRAASTPVVCLTQSQCQHNREYPRTSPREPANRQLCFLQEGIVKHMKVHGLCLYLRHTGSVEVGDGERKQEASRVAESDMLLQPLECFARLSLETGWPFPPLYDIEEHALMIPKWKDDQTKFPDVTSIVVS